SHSRLLDPALVGQEHVEIANSVRTLLQHSQALESAADTTLSNAEETLLARARRIERFLTQPFFVAEPYTHTPGQYVSREQTLQDFRALLSGGYDHLPEDAFLYCGPLAQAIAKAK